MQYFEEHFTVHHLLHAPHKWFFALLTSPIHYAEMHYKRVYRLGFENARKLFIFDMVLLSSMIVLIGTSIFWFLYDPSITRLTYLSITPSSDRVASGEFVTYRIDYGNSSEVKMLETEIVADFPKTFLIDKVNPAGLYDKEKNTFHIGTLRSGEKGQVEFSGWFYGTPNEEDHINVYLNYKQEGRDIKETRISPFIKTLRGSVLKTDVHVSQEILANGFSPIEITLSNTGDRPLEQVSLPLTFPNIKFENAKINTGEWKNNTWSLSSLAPKEKVILKATLATNIPENLSRLSITLQPTITLLGKKLPQAEQKLNFQIIRPKLVTEAKFEKEKIKPGEIIYLKLNLNNTGNTNLSDIELEIPLPVAIVNISQFKNLNSGKIKDNTLFLNKSFFAQLENINIGETKEIILKVPINKNPIGGNDLRLVLPIHTSGRVTYLPDSTFTFSTSSSELKIGTSLTVLGETRYYTNEGDQLGRGPLPPRVGQETKYWTLIKFANGTSNVSSARLEAELPSYVKWDNKYSISTGKQVTYDEKTRKITWTASFISAHEKGGVYIELSLTPNSIQVGQTPIILKNIQFSAHDEYIDTDIFIPLPDLDISLTADEIGRSKGTSVVE